MDLLLLSTVAFSTPKAPAPDPELQAQTKRREEEARQDRINIAKSKARSATYSLQRSGSTMLAGYGGYDDKKSTLG